MTRWFAAYVAVAVLAAVYAYLRPHSNWDLIPYAAIVTDSPGVSDSAWHAAVYRTVRLAVPPDVYNELTTPSDPYRFACATAPAVLRSQLPFYTTRIAYLAALRILHRAGLNPVHAMKLISVVAGLLIALLAWRLAAGRCAEPTAFAACTILLPAGGVVDLMRWSTPDALSTLILCLASWAVVANRAFSVLWILLLSALLVRPDALPAALILLAGAAAVRRNGLGREHPWLYLGAIALVLAAVEIAKLTEGYGYLTAFHHTFISRLVQPSLVSDGVTLDDYVLSVRHALIGIAVQPSRLLVLGAFLGSLLVFLSARRQSDRSLAVLFSAAGLAYIPIRILLFPLVEPRFFVLPALWAALALLYALPLSGSSQRNPA